MQALSKAILPILMYSSRDTHPALKQLRLLAQLQEISGSNPPRKLDPSFGVSSSKTRSLPDPKHSQTVVLDPVMGDEGRLYVNENVVPVYKNLLRDADLILPNQFEAELVFVSLATLSHLLTLAIRLLSETKITSLATLQEATIQLHKTHRIPHVIVTSVRLSDSPSTVTIIGSTARADFSPRLFRIDVPAIDCFFSGTGDMFAALTIVRLREAITEVGLAETKSWVSPDDVQATDLPLAKAVEKVLGSMHAVLMYTKAARDEELERMGGPLGLMEKEKDSEKRIGLRKNKAAEVRVVRCLGQLREPVVEWKAVAVEADAEPSAQTDSERRAISNNEKKDFAPDESENIRAGLGLQHLAGQSSQDDTQ